MDYKKILEQLISKLEASGARAEAYVIRDIATTKYSTETEWLGEVTLAVLDMVRYNEKLDNLVGAEAFDLKMYAKSIGLVVS